MGKWTQAQMDALADRFAQIFVEQVEAAGGKATIVSEEPAQQAGIADGIQMSRDIPFDEKAVCDGCGALGAFDFMGDLFCPKCLAEDDAAAQQAAAADAPSWDCQNCDNHQIGAAFTECPNCGMARG